MRTLVGPSQPRDSGRSRWASVSRHRAPWRALVTSLVLLLSAAACTGASTGKAAGSKPLRANLTSSVAAPPLIWDNDGSWGDTWSYNPFSPEFFGYLPGFALLPLAFPKPPESEAYVPEIAVSWTTTPSTVTVHLRRDARWQNGKPVTSQDVLTALLIDGANHNTLWQWVASARAAGPHTVVFDVAKGAPSKLLLNSVLGTSPVPTQEYGRYLVPGLEKDLVQYYALNNKNPTAAAASPEAKVMAAVLAKVEKFSPKTLVGDGPFQAVKITTQAALLRRSRDFWAASRIHVPEFEVLDFSGNGTVYPAMFSHQGDLTEADPTALQLQKWLRTKDAHYAVYPDYYAEGVYFNDHLYPLNLAGVRRALAYLINRPPEITLAYGTPQCRKRCAPPEDTVVTHPDGLLGVIGSQWLSRSQINSLDTYAYNPAKATRILDGLGFHKKGQWWYLPDGKQFVLTAYGPSGWDQTVEEMQIDASSFTKFGIKTTASAVEQPGYWTYQLKGQFDLDWGWTYTGELDPLAGLGSVLKGYNYVAAGERGIGFGPMATVPGLGRVNVPQALAEEASTVLPRSRTKQLVWDWARFINRQLPFLSVSDKNSTFAWSTAHYVDWPPRSNSYVWQALGYNYTGGWVVAMEDGYIRPRS